MIGEREYFTRKTLPRFAETTLEPCGIRCTFVHADPADGNDFPGLEALNEADLLFISVRRRTPPQAQLALVRKWVESGKPLVGIRTASHAFDRDPPPGHGRWATFDPEVLGGHYHGHHGNKPPDGPKSFVKPITTMLNHPILTGVPSDEIRVSSHLYKVRPLEKTATALMVGRVEGRPGTEPVAWTNIYKGGRIFYTSLGHPDEFAMPFFRRLLLNGILWALERQVPRRQTSSAPRKPIELACDAAIPGGR
jgi:type 1 glutamine amidotransferase